MLKYFSIILLMVGCTSSTNTFNDEKKTHESKSENNAITSTQSITVTKEGNTFNSIINHIIDTLEYYKTTSKFYIEYFESIYKLKGFTIDNERFAVGVILGQRLVVYHLKGQEWRKVYSEEVGMNPNRIKIKIIDLNFDDYNDVLVTNAQGAWGNEYSTAFLYNKEATTLKRTPFLDLRNISVDSQNKIIQTHSYRGYCWVRDKSQYKVANDTLLLIARAVYDPVDCNNKDAIPKTRIYKYKGGVVIDSSLFVTKNAWEIYLKSLWSNSKDYN